jgi:YgiT-type zinc finger domain-containing protein
MFRCQVCGNTESHGEQLNEVFNIEGRLVLVESIPATVCLRCGDVTFSRDTTERVRRMVRTQARPIRSKQVSVFAFG